MAETPFFDEHRHNTDEQARRYLVAALDLVDELEPPDDLRGLCFEKAVQLLSAKTLTPRQSPLAGATVVGRPGQLL